MSGYVFALIFAVGTVLIMFGLLRSRQMREKYATTWVLVCAVVLVLAVFPGLLEGAADLLGIATPVNLVFFVGALALLLISVQYSVELSRLEERTRTLAEEAAILRAEVERLRARVEEDERRAGPGGVAPR
ncbi:DUF2304 domain-containing protein [Georgenia sp. TF02-10]|uniref:DUF2304 domain-containing protein n=1 Tax=Georgenia sp. TF02-10 TaxID=2917725 RepID=UPI001FA76DBD|nr:DUF2304 domain-containing protein [Georgenia sp. TF02-10]UNX55762.1 DUF2304 domain-containing protein [Georgenia sp. TF02-10]